MEYKTLNNGVKMPVVGFGVFQVKDEEECKRVVLDAIDAGYRLIDTAQSYGNEEAVGKAIQETNVPREELFITTKVWISNYGYEKAKASVEALRGAGISKIVMMTGDSERTAAAIARRVGVDEYYSEVLPEDKANFIEKEKAAGRKVIMVGDGINDSPALSAANVGIAISDGAEIAREIADITVGADDLQELVVLKEISNALMKRIRRNYRFIITFNAGLIACGVAGILQPTSSALLHNTSTLAISLKSMQNLLP